MELFQSLALWEDGSRSGPENMAIDDVLSRVCTYPLLRVYGWRGSWMSIGYFRKAEEVAHGREFVRRPTGGGLVDHEADWTYSLIVPRGFDLAERVAAMSYAQIHERLSVFLRNSGVMCQIIDSQAVAMGADCFTNAVRYDVVDDLGKKIAGAGQRRTRHSLLHQGSVKHVARDVDLSAAHLAKCLAGQVKPFNTKILASHWPQISDSMYATYAWNFKR